MHEITVIVDGMEDIKYNELEGKTPFEYAYTPNIDSLGFKSIINNTPKGFNADSMCCILNIFGVDKKFIPVGRAYLEALSNGIKVNDDDLVLRCNTVKCDSYGKIIGNFNKPADVKDFEIYYIGDYRNIIVIRKGRKYFESLITFPPHQNFGKFVSEIQPLGNELADKLRLNCYDSVVWSPSVKTNIPDFKTIHNKRGAVICKTDIVKGIACAMNMFCCEPEGATGDIDTNLKSKAFEAVRLINDYDCVFLHLNGADEASHRKNIYEKIKFINDLDKFVIGYIIENCPKNTKIKVLSDHASICKNGKHSNIDVTCFSNYEY